jgi:hypothetical protein
MVVNQWNLNALFWGCLLLFVAFDSYAQTNVQLSASVDRNKIYENETVNLQLTGNMDVDISIGGLLSFGRSQMETPDISAIEKDFQILDQRQSYSMKTINGRSQSLTTWSYTLAPKRNGKLTIPAIDYQGISSNQIAIEVLAGSPPKNDDNPPPLFVEVEVDKKSAYVQEQLLYTVRLYAVSQVRGELSDPAPVNAIVERLGETKKYYRMAYNQRYEVQENTYLLFPQQSGKLSIEAQSFNGFVVDPRTRRRVHAREVSESLSVDIKPPPADFSGDIWLPAMSLELNETWQTSPDTTTVGDSLTRTLEVQALGLLGTALPPTTTADIKGFKVYPDQPEIESFAHKSGVQSRRRETTALVAIREGKAYLPEIKLPWWDTVNDVERIAVIPSREVSIVALSDEDSAAPTNPAQDAQSIPTQPDAELDSAEVTNPNASNDGYPDDRSQSQSESTPTNATPWLLIIALLLIGWASTTWFLVGRLRQPKLSVKDNGDSSDVNVRQIIKLLKNDDPDFSRRLIDWLQTQLPNTTIHSLRDIPDSWSDLRSAALAFEAKHYGKSGSLEAFDQTQLIEELTRLNKAQQARSPKQSSTLQPLYP